MNDRGFANEVCGWLYQTQSHRGDAKLKRPIVEVINEYFSTTRWRKKKERKNWPSFAHSTPSTTNNFRPLEFFVRPPFPDFWQVWRPKPKINLWKYINGAYFFLFAKFKTQEWQKYDK